MLIAQRMAISWLLLKPGDEEMRIHYTITLYSKISIVKCLFLNAVATILRVPFLSLFCFLSYVYSPIFS